MRGAPLAACAALLLAAGGCRAAPAWRAVSPDHGVQVLVREHGGRSCITIADRAPRTQCHDAVALAGIAFAERGGSVAYAARDAGRWTIVRDGRASAAWDGVGVPRLSPDGSRLAYPATDGREWRVVVDDDEVAGAPFDSIVDGSIVFDASGRRLGYVAWRRDAVHAVVDGQVSRAWSGASNLMFTRDGRHVAYVARQRGRATIVVNDEPGAEHEAIGEMTFAPAGRALAYSARDGSEWRVFGGAMPYGPYDAVRGLGMLRNGDDASPVFIASTHAGEAVVVGGVVHPVGGEVTRLVIAREGARWGYIADESAVYLDGRRIATGSRVTELAIADHGRRWAYLAADGDTTAVVDERGRHPFELIVEGSLQFVAAGDVAAWAALAGDRKRRELYVVVEGRRTRRRLDWSEMVRQARDASSAEFALRQWVAAAARLELREPPVR